MSEDRKNQARIQEEVRSFVVENFLFGDGSRIDESTSFLASGTIDSTGILELILFVEEQYGIQIEDTELMPQNMDSISNVAAFVRRKAASIVPPPSSPVSPPVTARGSRLS